jgi:hypothetical protein
LAIDRKLEAEKAGVMYVQGGHRTGKTTTLLKYIWDRSQDFRDGAPVVYLMASPVECAMLQLISGTASAQRRRGRRCWIGLADAREPWRDICTSSPCVLDRKTC